MGDPKGLSPTFLWLALPFSVDRSFEVWGVFGVTPSAELVVMPREPLLPPRIQPQLFVCLGVDETEEPSETACSPRYTELGFYFIRVEMAQLIQEGVDLLRD